MSRYSEDLLEYYKRELTYVRRMGIAFARQYPKVAGRLELGIDNTPDPHIERLIESFAFLTARIQYNIESEFPQISTALLEILYPQLVRPVPSMTIARFDVDPDQGKLTTGHVIPRGSQLISQTQDEQICRFRTCFPVELWPVTVSDAEFVSTDRYPFLDRFPEVVMVLKIRIQSLYENFAELAMRRLRFHINADRILAGLLYELLFCYTQSVALLPGGRDHPILLDGDALSPVGFDSEEAVLPYPETAHPGYRLVQEYFTFSEKFLFFDIDGINRYCAAADPAENHFDILILLNHVPKTRMTIDRETFCLGCTPVINLFPKTTDPIRIDGSRAEYRLNPDERRESITEIHTIEKVSATPNPHETAVEVMPFFSYDHRMTQEKSTCFWHARRQETGRQDLPGTEIYMTFLDLNFKPELPPTAVLYAHTLCTNRHLAEQLPAGALFQIEQVAPLHRIYALRKPTPQLTPPLSGGALWRLISHLSLNYMSLSEGEESLKALKEILRLYSFSDRISTEQALAGIREMSCQQVVRRLGDEAWRGFCRGLSITLVFDERAFSGSSVFLLASVLNRFFPLYTSLNSYTQLNIKSQQREGIWNSWPPRVGEQIMH